MSKQSYYNIWEGNILYNSFSDKAIAFKDDEILAVKQYLENPSVLKKEFPEIYFLFTSAHFIIPDTLDEYRYLMYQNRNVTTVRKNYHLTINPTLLCNYRCWYCCVEEQHTKYEKRRMDDQTIDNLCCYISEIVHYKGADSMHIDWFGGEPLMYFNEVVLPISKLASEKCKQYNVPFSNHVTTNAYYIDDKMIDFFNSIQLNSFQIPLDGNEKRHNLIKNIDGVGHYRQIMNTINLLCENVYQSKIILRINYDAKTLENITDIISDIRKENRKKILVDLQRVWQVDLVKDENGNNNRLIEVKQQFEKNGFNVNYFAFNHKRYRSCYADNYYHQVINYDGKIYKCAARNYSEELCIGKLKKDGKTEINEEHICNFFSFCTFDNETCRKCKMLPLCYGPCVQKSYDHYIKGKSFQCLYDVSELSLKWYIRDKIHQQNEYIRKTQANEK